MNHIPLCIYIYILFIFCRLFDFIFFFFKCLLEVGKRFCALPPLTGLENLVLFFCMGHEILSTNHIPENIHFLGRSNFWMCHFNFTSLSIIFLVKISTKSYIYVLYHWKSFFFLPKQHANFFHPQYCMFLTTVIVSVSVILKSIILKCVHFDYNKHYSLIHFCLRPSKLIIFIKVVLLAELYCFALYLTVLDNKQATECKKNIIFSKKLIFNRTVNMLLWFTPGVIWPVVSL